MNEPDPSPQGLSQFLQRLFSRLSPKAEHRQDLLDHLREAQAHSVIDEDAVSMMQGVLQVSDLEARDIMIPRSQIDVLDINAPFHEMLGTVIRTAHSRFPVVDGQKDDIIGILLAKDLLRVVHQDQPNIRALLRPAVFVPESKRLNVLLRDFRQNRNHIALVVDEYGGIAGLATIEDVLEQIVGEIEDEHDTDEGMGNIMPLGRTPGRFRVRATTPLDQFNTFFGVQLVDEQIDTIGGLLMNMLGHVPQAGESLLHEGLHFEIQRSDGRTAQVLIVERRLPAEPESPVAGDESAH